VDIENRYRMIIEPERSGKTISDVCIAFGVSRETWYKWKRRYDAYGIDGLKDQSRKPHNIKNVKVTEKLEKLVLELRLNNRFGPMRIRFRLKRKYGVSLGTKTIYNILKILSCCVPTTTPNEILLVLAATNVKTSSGSNTV
jgi:transposase